MNVRIAAALIVIGFVFLVKGADLFVDNASGIAKKLGVSPVVIGMTIVAVGTSLPELVTSVVAARKGENDIAMGNVIGSNLFNILCILGVSALLHPIHVEVTALYDTAFLVVVTVVYWLICRHRSPDRLIGTAMILTDIGYMAYIILR